MYILILVSLLKNYAEIIGGGRVGPCDLKTDLTLFFPFVLATWLADLSSLPRDSTCAPWGASSESQPLDLQESS